MKINNKDMIKKQLYIIASGIIAALAFTSCTQEDLMDGDNLPEGKYPLEIASVTVEAESSVQPWGGKAPQSRVSENTDGTGTVWEKGDVFYVKFEGSDQVGTYTISDATAGTVEAVTPVYWTSASKEQTIIAWYAPQQKGTINVSDQTGGLIYVIRATNTATCNNGAAVSLNFAHQLAKVRVYLRGSAYEGNAKGGTQVIDLSKLTSTYEINDNGTYYFIGSGSYGIKASGGSPDIYLDDADISVASGNGIDITSGSATIHVLGANNQVSSSDGAGIHVAEGSTLNITGNSRNDRLEAVGNLGSSGIGGYVIDDSKYQYANCGHIYINSITVSARSRGQSRMGTVSPAIGSTGNGSCQSISIDNATVHAYGSGDLSATSPAIGNGMDFMGDKASSLPYVTISNYSVVHAHRGKNKAGNSFADYIGSSGLSYSPPIQVRATVDATSVVYKYTGAGNTQDP